MPFKDQLTQYTASQIITALGCPRATAYDWLDGRREPPEWQQPHWLTILAKRVKPVEKKKPEAH
ncbi:hypothetical protein [Verrucomicrobium spinosum]|uniref:hypothetical protein n=1 Tax=Verrucomicrobium spinosum TaxID=2736 RepID=UPI0001746663|nr:hypothetical protein [Verrucomicrobium spinosum]